MEKFLLEWVRLFLPFVSFRLHCCFKLLTFFSVHILYSFFASIGMGAPWRGYTLGPSWSRSRRISWGRNHKVYISSLFLHTSSSKSKASHEPGRRYAFEKYSAQRKPTYSRFLSSWRFVFNEVVYGIYKLPDEFCSSHNHWSDLEIKFNWQK